MYKEILYKKYLYESKLQLRDRSNISDTWKKTLSKRKIFFLRKDFENMRRPGNPVTARFIDTTYLLDSDFFKRKNKEFDRILKLREPNFGNPHKDIIKKKPIAVCFSKEAYYYQL